MATLTVVLQARRPGIDIQKVCKRVKDHINSTTYLFLAATRRSPEEAIRSRNKRSAVCLVGAGLILSTLMATPVLSAELSSVGSSCCSSLLLLSEPSNALSLPTWAIHISCVIEWITAMALAWEYGEKSGNESWKGLSWGMVPLLGGALCCCTWHFFYNSESLEVLVTLQGALTVIGNATLCLAAFRIYSSSQDQSKKL